jgi:hypothetical protein
MSDKRKQGSRLIFIDFSSGGTGDIRWEDLAAARIYLCVTNFSISSIR